MKKLASALARALRESGVDRSTVLNNTGIGATAMSRYLSAKAIPTPESLARIMSQLPEKHALEVFSAYLKETLPDELSEKIQINAQARKSGLLREEDEAYKCSEADEELEDSLALLRELSLHRSDIREMLIQICDVLNGK